ncbi:MAG: aminotransferase class V-fold PLP-dependent enzyme [Saprospiraceae bacterium]
MEEELLSYGTERLSAIEGFTPYGIAPEKSGVISFNIGQSHPYDVGTILDKLGIAVRTGHHCTQPLMDRFNIPVQSEHPLEFTTFLLKLIF